MPDKTPNDPRFKGSTETEKKKPDGDAEEWGERVETGRHIARGGKEDGEIDGATGDDPDNPRSGKDDE